jgi:aminopeptidase-like protein
MQHVRKRLDTTLNHQTIMVPSDFISLTRDLCAFATGVVADDNERLFARVAEELPLTLLRYQSGDTFNGWLVPQNWRVEKAEIRRDGRVVFDGLAHTLGVARYAKSFSGSLDWDDLKPHLVTNPALPSAYVFHCMWQYRPWAADWAMSVPYEIFRELGPGRYEVELRTTYAPGEMIVAEHEKKGRNDRTIVFHSNSCHPHMANDGFAGTAVLIRLFQWLAAQDTMYTYRLVIGPEHIGTVFYLRDHEPAALDRIVCGVFEEMPGTQGPIKVASTFLGGQKIDRAFRNAVRHHARAHALVPWRQGAGNDETVWEAPGYEVPFVEVTRSETLLEPYREYHTSLDTPELMDPVQLDEFLTVLKKVVESIENDARIHRRFDGLICLSNPRYDLYMERKDPSIDKNLPEDAEKWGYLLDCLLRYFDGSLTILDIAEKHDLPFDRVRRYIERFAEKGLVALDFDPILREPARRAVPR